MWAQAPAPQPLIYTCTNAAGKKLTSDRPIPECNDRETRVLNSDGSVRNVIGPTMTADERAEAELRELRRALEEKQKREAVLRDRNLRARFPDEAAHRKAREAALEDVRKGIRLSESRLAALAKERKPLMDEAEFYVGKALPINIKTQIDANDASVDAQRTLLQNQKLEAVRIDAYYDAELERLKRLWGGAQPGSMGIIVAPTPAPAPKKELSRASSSATR
ncbi:MAG: hypothetical protein ABI702_11410 [Burkholderiales bacterium]